MKSKILSVLTLLILLVALSTQIYAISSYSIEPLVPISHSWSSVTTALLPVSFDKNSEGKLEEKEEVTQLETTTTYVSDSIYSNMETRQVEGISLTDEEYNLLCDVVCLEAGGEGEDLQRAVTEVIYNRLICGIWGTTVSEVIYSPNQFSVVPYLYKADPSDLTKEVVKDVFINGNVKIKSSVLYFRTDYYHQWYGASPEFNIGNVYFSSTIWW